MTNEERRLRTALERVVSYFYERKKVPSGDGMREIAQAALDADPAPSNRWKAKAIWCKHGWYNTFPEGGDEWGALGPNTRLFERTPEDASAHTTAQRLRNNFMLSGVEIVDVTVTIEPWSPG